jgi:hypothetical protein
MWITIFYIIIYLSLIPSMWYYLVEVKRWYSGDLATFLAASFFPLTLLVFVSYGFIKYIHKKISRYNYKG